MLAPGQHTFRLDYSQNSVPNLPAGNGAALMLQVRGTWRPRELHSGVMAALGQGRTPRTHFHESVYLLSCG